MAKPIQALDTLLQAGRAFGVRDGMLRLGYEIQRGSGLMAWKMRTVQGWDPWNLKRIAPDASAERIRAARVDGTLPFFFTDVRSLQTRIKKILTSTAADEVLSEATGVLDGNLPFFGGRALACGSPPNWFRNPVSGQRVSPQQPWTQMRFASADHGDLKFILEPSRFLFVYPLIRAYALCGDEKFAAAFWNILEDWARHNPPMDGPLWICGQECSLRIVAWSFALHAFIHSPSTTKERVAMIVSMIAAHAWRTAQTIGYARSQRSNHLISEAVGLWTAGTLYPELREAKIWQNLGAHLLYEAVLDQITPEGVPQQHSFNYQRMILHLLLWTVRLARTHGFSLDDEVHNRTQAAFEFMRRWIDPTSGQAPNHGSNDGSIIFPLTQGPFCDFRPLLQLGAAVLNRPGLQPGPWDEAALWFGVEPKAITQKVTEASLFAHDNGYFRLGDETSWALIRAGRYTRRPFQADQLHVDLWWQGINLARDAGTYLYNGSPPWNNGLAGSAIHNTVTIDHQDQMRRAGRFLWIDWAQASGRLFASPDNAHAQRFEGEHDGYRRFGVTHRRTVQWLGNAGWVIVDDIEGPGEHDVCLHWLTADLPYEVVGSHFEVVFRAGQSPIRWSVFPNVPGSAAIIRGGKQLDAMAEVKSKRQIARAGATLLGWESPTYGELRPAVSLLYATRSQLPVRFVTVVLTGERCRLDLQGGDIVLLENESGAESANQREICRVSLSAQEMPPATRFPVSVPTA